MAYLRFATVIFFFFFALDGALVLPTKVFRGTGTSLVFVSTVRNTLQSFLVARVVFSENSHASIKTKSCPNFASIC